MARTLTMTRTRWRAEQQSVRSRSQEPAGPAGADRESSLPDGVLPDGVLAKAGPVMSAVIGVIAVAAMAEAGWNLGTFVYDILHLPVALAAVFPVIAEATASSFAVQDLRDRRQGVPSTGLRVATYVTLAVSAAVNGVVGAVRYGPGGLLEVLAPLALGAVVHLHGDRATRAYQSRARLSPGGVRSRSAPRNWSPSWRSCPS
jgi:Protein of unknown function (DUF2637)